MTDHVDHPELAADRVATITADLVRTRSVNPDDGEAVVAERVLAQLAGTRCELTRVESLPGRPSVAAVLRGTADDGPRLVVNGHLDTVSPGELARWTVDPFGGELRDGAVWGRGATDMKGGLACQIACARALSALPPLRGTLVLHFAAGEERGEPGTRSLIERGFVGDWGIVTEPTDLRVAIAQRGTAWYRIAIAGRAAHAATRDEGDNPLLRLAALLAALARYDAALAERTHPLLGRALCTPTVVRGGDEPHMLAEWCELWLDCRTLPGDASAGELRRLVDHLNAADPARPYRIEQRGAWQPTEVAPGSHFVRTASAVAADVLGERHEPSGTPLGTDVSELVHRAGMEAIMFGPGDPDGCHGPDERCSVQRLGQCAQALARIAVAMLGPVDAG